MLEALDCKTMVSAGGGAMDLHGNEHDVQFAHESAVVLARRFRDTAKDLEDQAIVRAAHARTAREEWRGRYAEQFDERVRLCTSDAKEFATHMREAADMLDELRELAEREQRRREVAREWHARQQEESVVKSGVDWLMGWDQAPTGPEDGPLRSVTINPCAPRPE